MSVSLAPDFNKVNGVQGGGVNLNRILEPESTPRKNSPPESEALNRISSRGMYPLEPYPGNATIPWKMACIDCGSERERPLRKWRQLGCQGCSKRMLNDEVAAILGVGPLRIADSYKSAKAVPVECQVCGETFAADVTSFKLRGTSPCKFCRGKRLSSAQVKARLDSSPFEAAGPLPDKATQIFLARCRECGGVSEKTIAGITRGNGCRFCAPNAPVDPKDAATLFLSRGLVPVEDFPGANKPWRSVCENCGELPAPTYSSLLNNEKRKCEYCSGKAVNPDTASKTMLEHGFIPLVEYPGSLNPWLSKCTSCNRQPTPTYSGVINGKRCGYCFPGGVDFKLPGVLYLMGNFEKAALKIGIQTYSSNRVASHVKNGWSVEHLWLAPTGEVVHSIEQAVKASLRFGKKLSGSLDSLDMPVGGHTETFLLAEVSVEEIYKEVTHFNEIGGGQCVPLTLSEFQSSDFQKMVENMNWN